jgi:hypothetical protein
MQVVALKAQVATHPTVRTKIKCRIKELVRFIVTRGTAAEESRGATPRVMFRPRDVGAETWVATGTSLMCLLGEAPLIYLQTGHFPFLRP